MKTFKIFFDLIIYKKMSTTTEEPKSYTIDYTKNYSDQDLMQSFKTLAEAEDYSLEDLANDKKKVYNVIKDMKLADEEISDDIIRALKYALPKWIKEEYNDRMGAQQGKMTLEDTSDSEFPGSSSTSMYNNKLGYLEVNDLGENTEKYSQGEKFTGKQFIPNLIDKIVGGDSVKLIGKYENEETVDTKVQGMITQLLLIGVEKYNKIASDKGEQLVTEDVNGISAIFGQTVLNDLKTLTLDGLRKEIGTITNKIGEYIVYYKALKACKSSKDPYYKIKVQKTTRTYGNEIRNTSEMQDYSESINDPKQMEALKTNKIRFYINRGVWNRNTDMKLTASQIMLNMKDDFFDKCLNYGVITLSDVNALIQPFFDSGRTALKWKKVRGSIGIEEIPTSAFERSQVKKTNDALKSAKKKLYKTSGKTDPIIQSKRDSYLMQLKHYE